MQRSTFLKMATLTLLGAAPHALSQTEYTVEFIGVATHVDAVNNLGQAVGWRSDFGLQAWVGTGEHGIIDLPLPDGYNSGWARDINDAGVIVGSISTGGFPEFGQAARWTPNGAGGYTVDLLGALPGHTQSIATSINELGDIVGYSIIPGFQGGPGVWFNSPSGVLNLNDFGLQSTADDINNNRVVVSGRTLLDLDSMTVQELPIPEIEGLPAFTGLVYTNAINDMNQVVGHALLACCTNSNHINVRYTPGVGWEAVFPIGTRYGSAYGIADSGAVVHDNGGSAVYVTLANGAMFNLDDVQDVATDGWLFNPSFGGDINDQGQIVGTASNPMLGLGGVVILTPIPTCSGDADGSGVIDINDLNVVIGNFGTPGPDGDVDSSGAVDFNDLNLVLGNFGDSCL